MCLVLLAYQQHHEFPIILLSNRDEYFARSTQPLSVGPGPAGIVAARDNWAGGTWLGINRQGYWAALTNIRQLLNKNDSLKKHSRGKIVSDYLMTNSAPLDFLEELQRQQQFCLPFNLLLGDPKQIYYYSSLQPQLIPLAPGFYGLSNASLNTPWPKVRRGVQLLQEVVCGVDVLDASKLLGLLGDTIQPADDELPNTGLSLSLERRLAPLFIQRFDISAYSELSSGISYYGTTISSLLTINNAGLAILRMQHHDEGNRRYQRSFFCNNTTSTTL